MKVALTSSIPTCSISLPKITYDWVANPKLTDNIFVQIKKTKIKK
jgi:hypothetical protein